MPSLIDQAEYFYNFEYMPEFLSQVKLDQLAMEFRGQIEALLAAGLKPTHLDWHSLRIGGREDIFDLMLRLASAVHGVPQLFPKRNCKEKPLATVSNIFRTQHPQNDFYHAVSLISSCG